MITPKNGRLASIQKLIISNNNAAPKVRRQRRNLRVTQSRDHHVVDNVVRGADRIEPGCLNRLESGVEIGPQLTDTITARLRLDPKESSYVVADVALTDHASHLLGSGRGCSFIEGTHIGVRGHSPDRRDRVIMTIGTLSNSGRVRRCAQTS